MKRTILYILMIPMFFSACNKDLLEKYPETVLNPQIFWKNRQDVLAAANGLYQYLPSWSSMMLMDEWTDHAVNSSPTQNGKLQGLQEAYDTWGFSVQNQWANYYKGITATNYFLENSSNVVNVDATFMLRTKAEARFIRAFIYMQLVMDFGDVPLITKVLTAEEGRNVTRAPANDVWDFIESELSEISDNLNIKYTGSDIGRITRGAALALKTKSMLYAGRYGKAYTAAKTLIDMNVYSLYPDFYNLFGYTAENNSEIILDVQYAKDIKAYNIFFQYAPIEMSKNFTCTHNISSDLVNAFQMKTTGLSINEPGSEWNLMNPYKDRDPRLNATILIPYFSETTEAFIMWNSGNKLRPQPGSGTVDEIGVGIYRNLTGFFLKKYINQEDITLPTNCGVNFILIRYADVLLMAAEALIESNQNLPEAKGYIDQVRARAGLPPLGASITNQDDLRQAVRQERNVELACEGWRFYDICRWKIAETIVKGNVLGMSYVNASGIVVTIDTKVVRAFNTKDYLFPIPYNERVLNPNLTQNPGY